MSIARSSLYRKAPRIWQSKALHNPRNMRVLIGRSKPEDKNDKEDDIGNLFMKELQKRNISSVDDIDLIEEERNLLQQPFARNDPPPQLTKSRSIGGEGLEGLIPRATELIKLGLSFFLAFGPFIVAVTLAFVLFTSLLGDSFVHGGTPSNGQPMYDPNELLSEPTADPMIPLR